MKKIASRLAAVVLTLVLLAQNVALADYPCTNEFEWYSAKNRPVPNVPYNLTRIFGGPDSGSDYIMGEYKAEAPSDWRYATENAISNRFYTYSQSGPFRVAVPKLGYAGRWLTKDMHYWLRHEEGKKNTFNITYRGSIADNPALLSSINAGHVKMNYHILTYDKITMKLGAKVNGSWRNLFTSKDWKGGSYSTLAVRVGDWISVPANTTELEMYVESNGKAEAKKYVMVLGDDKAPTVRDVRLGTMVNGSFVQRSGTPFKLGDEVIAEVTFNEYVSPTGTLGLQVTFDGASASYNTTLDLSLVNPVSTENAGTYSDKVYFKATLDETKLNAGKSFTSGNAISALLTGSGKLRDLAGNPYVPFKSTVAAGASIDAVRPKLTPTASTLLTGMVRSGKVAYPTLLSTSGSDSGEKRDTVWFCLAFDQEVKVSGNLRLKLSLDGGGTYYTQNGASLAEQPTSVRRLFTVSDAHLKNYIVFRFTVTDSLPEFKEIALRGYSSSGSDRNLLGALDGSGKILDASGNDATTLIMSASTMPVMNTTFDRTPPSVTITTPKTYAQTQSAVVTVTDGGSGVENNSFFYEVVIKDGNSFYPAGTTGSNGALSTGTTLQRLIGTNNSTAADYYLEVTASDNAGNKTVAHEKLYLDLFSPTITQKGEFKVEQAGDNSTKTGTLTLEVTDAQSGVDQDSGMYKWVDEGRAAGSVQWTNTPGQTTFQKSVSPDQMASGIMIVRYSDNAGNGESFYSQNLVVDNRAPVYTFTQLGSTAWARSHKAQISRVAADTSVYYQWSASLTPTPERFAAVPAGGVIDSSALGAVTGQYYLHIRAVNTVTNNYSTFFLRYQFDNQAPTVTVTPLSAHAGSAHDFDVTITDGHAGFHYYNKAYYWLADAKGHAVTESRNINNNYTLRVSYTPENEAKLEKLHLVVQAEDVLGNITTFTCDTPVLFDSGPPEAAVTSIADAGKKELFTVKDAAVTTFAMNGNGYNLAGDLTVKLSLGDNTSGRLDWRLLDKYSQQVSAGFVIRKTDTEKTEASVILGSLPDGLHEYTLEVTDVSGNRTTTRFDIQRDTLPPVLSIRYPNTRPTNEPAYVVLISDGDSLVSDPVFDLTSTGGAVTLGYDYSPIARELLISENGVYTIGVSDAAGNKAQVTVAVDWVDTGKPTMEMTASNFGTGVKFAKAAFTAADVENSVGMYFTLTGENGNDDATNQLVVSQEGEGKYLVEFCNLEGDYTLTASAIDAAGNMVSQDYPVTMINPEPEIEFHISPSGLTRGPVLVTYSSDENVELMTFHDDDDALFDFLCNTYAAAGWIGNFLYSADNPAEKEYCNSLMTELLDWCRAQAIDLSFDRDSLEENPFLLEALSDESYLLSADGVALLRIIFDHYNAHRYMGIEEMILDNTPDDPDSTPPDGKDQEKPTFTCAENVTDNPVTDFADMVKDWTMETDSFFIASNGTYTRRFKDAAGNISEHLLEVDCIVEYEVPYADFRVVEKDDGYTMMSNSSPDTFFTKDFAYVSLAGGVIEPEKPDAGEEPIPDYDYYLIYNLRLVNGDTETPLTGLIDEMIWNADGVYPRAYATVTADKNQLPASLLEKVGDVTLYSSVFFEADKPMHIRYDVVDPLTGGDNPHTVNTQELYINCFDKVDPVISVSVNQQGSVKKETGVTANISATDNKMLRNYHPLIISHNGTADITAYQAWNLEGDVYQLIEGDTVIHSWNPKTGVFRFGRNDEITITALDDAGNTATETLNITCFDDVKPEVTAKAYMHTSTGWTEFNLAGAEKTNQPVMVTFTATDKNDLARDTGTAYFAETNRSTYSVILEDNGVVSAKALDQAGNESDALTISVDCIDKTPPQLVSVKYNTYESTNQNITATIVLDEAAESVSDAGATTADKLTFTYTFKENGTKTLRFADAAGNSLDVPLAVSWIDRYPPVVTEIRSTTDRTRDSVIVTLAFDKVNVEVYDTDAQRPGSSQFVFAANGTKLVTFKDQAGNVGTHTIAVSNIDIDPPKIKHADSGLTLPGEYHIVIASEETDDVLWVSDGSGTYRLDPQAGEDSVHVKIVHLNGDYPFTIKDSAGNTLEHVHRVTQIDREAPTITPSASTTAQTKGDVTVTFSFSEPVARVDRPGIVQNYNDASSYSSNPVTVTATRNGTYSIEVRDLAGNVSFAEITVSNIDKEAPVFTTPIDDIVVVQGTTKPLNDVVATDTGSGIDTVTNDGGSINWSVPGKHEVKYTATDKVGNTAVYVRRVWILSDTDVALYVNGQNAMTGDVVIEGRTIKLTIFNEEKAGKIIVRMEKGYLTAAQMKDSAIMPDKQRDFTVDGPGWYSFTVQTADRALYHTRVYVS